MSSGFIRFVCSWFLGLNNPSYSVLVTQEVHSSGSVKRSLSLVCHNICRVFLVSCSSFISIVRYSLFWFRNVSFILVWGIVRECGLENMTVGLNNAWFVLVIC